MAKCIRCGSETQLYNGGIPVCISCVDTQAPLTRPTVDAAAQLPNEMQLELPRD